MTIISKWYIRSVQYHQSIEILTFKKGQWPDHHLSENRMVMNQLINNLQKNISLPSLIWTIICHLSVDGQPGRSRLPLQPTCQRRSTSCKLEGLVPQRQTKVSCKQAPGQRARPRKRRQLTTSPRSRSWTPLESWASSRRRRSHRSQLMDFSMTLFCLNCRLLLRILEHLSFHCFCCQGCLRFSTWGDRRLFCPSRWWWIGRFLAWTRTTEGFWTPRISRGPNRLLSTSTGLLGKPKFLQEHLQPDHEERKENLRDIERVGQKE